MADVKQQLGLAGYNANGSCYGAALALGIKLAAKGIPSRLVHGSVRFCMHFWLETADKTILDPTKRQFPGCRWSEYNHLKYDDVDFFMLSILLFNQPDAKPVL